jgi:hypothetical protein
MDHLDKYKTDNLMLLMGTNPLPNYVSARMLCKPDTRLHLVVTPEIQRTTLHERLVSLLGKDPKDQSQYLLVESSDPGNIFNGVSKRVRTTPGTWGLNYTGGKKSMATHAYRAMEMTLVKENREKGIYSYLDADRVELVIDPVYGINSLYFPIQEQVSLEQLLNLHGQPDRVLQKVRWTEPDDENIPLLTNKPRRTPYLPEFCRVWLEASLDSEKSKVLNEWHSLQPFYASGKSKDSIRDQDYQTLLFPEIIRSHPDVKYRSIAEMAEKTDQKIKHIVKWLDGMWLEHYVLAQVLAVKDECGINDYALGLESNIFEPVDPRQDTFQSDVIAMRGHRLFYLSVTTDRAKSTNKNKLFEAYHRAQQLGGEHAEAGMVTFFENPDRLVNELRDERHAHVRVFGPQHLISQEIFQAELKRWFTAIPAKEERS